MAEDTAMRIGGFRILGELKRGAQGVVYSAVSETKEFPGCPPGTPVALKAMQVSDDGGAVFRRLKERTAKLAAINHANVVKYYGCFVVQEPLIERHVVVMEFLEGETLKERLLREKAGLDADVAVRMTEAICSGLSAAAKNGICHRDVKPANIFICRDGMVKMIDFEVARFAAATTVSCSTDRMVGSFDYMAPDFSDTTFCGDEQSDVFSVGVVMHEMLTCSLPYKKFQNIGENVKADFAYLARWARNPDGSFVHNPIAVSTRIRRLLAHSGPVFAGSLSPDRAERFRSFEEFRAALKNIRFMDLRVEDRAYRILQLVGKGGFGEVFKARRRSSRQLVAVKHLLNSDYADRFYREAKIMAQLSDPCFVRFLDFMVVVRSGNKDAFLVMDFLPGMPGNALKDAIRAAPDGMPKADVLAAFARYAHGLKVMHSRGIFHRDIKPANLYYPAGHPENSAIMDFGIARDVNGTVTTGNVPGTFDYMSPEVVVQKNRGESGMDIYALGLCLYEALTGKMGFPRLPRGYAAYAQFFQRAQTLAKPVFDSPIVTSDPPLLALITEMTEPDVKKRLVNTAEVERRLQALAARRSVRMMPDEAPTDTVDPDSSFAATETSGMIPTTIDSPAPPRPQHSARKPAAARVRRSVRSSQRTDGAMVGRILRTSAVVMFMAVVAIAAWRFGPVGVELAKDGVSSLVEKWKSRKIDSLVQQAKDEAADIKVDYGNVHLSVDDVDKRRDAWKGKWATSLPQSSQAMILEQIENARSARLKRDEDDKARREILKEMDTEAKTVSAAYAASATTNDVAHADSLGSAFKDKWEKKGTDWKSRYGDFGNERQKAMRRIEEARVRELADKAAVPVDKSYLKDSLEIADKLRDVWVHEWRERLTVKDYSELSGKLEKIRQKAVEKRRKEEERHQEEVLQEDCKRLFDQLDPVEFRSARLNDAENRISAAVRAGYLTPKVRKELEERLSQERKLIVFKVSNKSDREISVGDERIDNGAWKILVYTNSLPSDLAVKCDGFEPMPIYASSKGQTVHITPERMTMERVAVTVPEFGDDVVCRIDGAPVKAGVIELMPGSHECVYIRKGGPSQVVPFLVEIARPISLQPPGPWYRE